MIDYTKRSGWAADSGRTGGGAPPTWERLVDHVARRYPVRARGEKFLVVDTDSEMDGEPQVVSLRHTAMTGSPEQGWIVIQSPIAELGLVDPGLVVQRVGLYMLGGVVADDEFLCLRHSVSLPESTPGGVTDVVTMVGSIAHKIEAWLLGNYSYREG